MLSTFMDLVILSWLVVDTLLVQWRYLNTRWWNNLSRCNFNLVHIPGMKLIQANALSHQPDHTQGKEEDELVTMLLTNIFLNLISINLRNQINQLTKTNTYASNILNCIKTKSLPLWTALSGWTLDAYKVTCHLTISTSHNGLHHQSTH